MNCPWCGPNQRPIGNAATLYGNTGCGTTHDGERICPTCDMTPGEHAYTERILADSDAVFRQEWREFQAKRQQERERVA